MASVDVPTDSQGSGAKKCSASLSDVDLEGTPFVTVHAGGSQFLALRETLEKSPTLKRLLQEERRRASSSTADPTSQRVFVETPPDIFSLVLTYLRTGELDDYLEDSFASAAEVTKREGRFGRALRREFRLLGLPWPRRCMRCQCLYDPQLYEDAGDSLEGGREKRLESAADGEPSSPRDDCPSPSRSGSRRLAPVCYFHSGELLPSTAHLPARFSCCGRQEGEVGCESGRHLSTEHSVLQGPREGAFASSSAAPLAVRGSASEGEIEIHRGEAVAPPPSEEAALHPASPSVGGEGLSSGAPGGLRLSVGRGECDLSTAATALSPNCPAAVGGEASPSTSSLSQHRALSAEHQTEDSPSEASGEGQEIAAGEGEAAGGMLESSDASQSCPSSGEEEEVGRFSEDSFVEGAGESAEWEGEQTAAQNAFSEVETAHPPIAAAVGPFSARGVGSSGVEGVAPFCPATCTYTPAWHAAAPVVDAAQPFSASLPAAVAYSSSAALPQLVYFASTATAASISADAQTAANCCLGTVSASPFPGGGKVLGGARTTAAACASPSPAAFPPSLAPPFAAALPALEGGGYSLVAQPLPFGFPQHAAVVSAGGLPAVAASGGAVVGGVSGSAAAFQVTTQTQSSLRPNAEGGEQSGWGNGPLRWTPPGEAQPSASSVQTATAVGGRSATAAVGGSAAAAADLPVSAQCAAAPVMFFLAHGTQWIPVLAADAPWQSACTNGSAAASGAFLRGGVEAFPLETSPEAHQEPLAAATAAAPGVEGLGESAFEHDPQFFEEAHCIDTQTDKRAATRGECREAGVAAFGGGACRSFSEPGGFCPQIEGGCVGDIEDVHALPTRASITAAAPSGGAGGCRSSKAALAPRAFSPGRKTRKQAGEGPLPHAAALDASPTSKRNGSGSSGVPAFYRKATAAAAGTWTGGGGGRLSAHCVSQTQTEESLGFAKQSAPDEAQTPGAVAVGCNAGLACAAGGGRRGAASSATGVAPSALAKGKDGKGGAFVFLNSQQQQHRPALEGSPVALHAMPAAGASSNPTQHHHPHHHSRNAHSHGGSRRGGEGLSANVGQPAGGGGVAVKGTPFANRMLKTSICPFLKGGYCPL